MSAPVALPPSASNFWVNLAGGFVFLIGLLFFKYLLPGLPVYIPVIIATGVSYILILLLEVLLLKVHLRPSVQQYRVQQPRSWARIRAKMSVVTLMLLVAGIVYTALPLYEQASYVNFIIILPELLLAAWLVALAYISAFDGRFQEEGDSLLQVGCWISGTGQQPPFSMLRDLLLLFILRAFFIPLMFISLAGNTAIFMVGIPEFVNQHLPPSLAPGGGHYQLLKALITIYFFFTCIDVMFAVIGYITMFKVTDSHARSVFRSPLAWLVGVGCYQPFFTIFIAALALPMFTYNPQWFYWLEGNITILTLWGCLVIVLMCIESFATLSFGIRFSNLTYRGLITSGVYRFSKHPQYIAKLLGRCAVFMPFFSLHGTIGVVANVWTFIFLATIYFLRARTEENHLAQYPEYVEYARYIEQYGLFRKFGQWFSVFRFDPTRAATGKLL